MSAMCKVWAKTKLLCFSIAIAITNVATLWFVFRSSVVVDTLVKRVWIYMMVLTDDQLVCPALARLPSLVVELIPSPVLAQTSDESFPDSAHRACT